MFLVGITGSLMPFLFLLGVVFVFSIQTSAQSLDDAPNFDKETALSHEFYCPSSVESNSGADIHFSQAYSCNSELNKTQVSGWYCMMQCLPEALMPGFSTLMSGWLLMDGQYSSCFPGLSPPSYC